VEGGESTFVLKVDPTGLVRSIELNGSDILRFYSPSKLLVQQTSIFPEIALAAETAPGPNEVYFGRQEATFYKSLSDLIAPHLDKRMKRPAVESLALALLSQEHLSKETLLSYAQETHVRSWRKLLTEIATKDRNDLYPAIRHLFLGHRLLPLMRGVTETLRSIVSDILYIGPARAGSERYYRYQDLSVSEIDPNGNNFPMFLNSLPEWQVNDLSDWVERLFGYRVMTSKSSGHISINIVEGSSETNLVDTGYGVSQILPVLGQIWWSGNRDRTTPRSQRKRQVSILAIEQPELHLHPAHQALLADALVNNPARSSRLTSTGRTHFVVETHSETLINRLGELIASKRLSAEDVQIVLFEPDAEGARKTDVRIARFGADGELINWPYGFFQPSI
jgi:hypothetical protein